MFRLTQQERFALAVLASLIVLGVIGLWVL